MSFEVPQPVRPADVEKWVYIEDTDEPTVFECEAHVEPGQALLEPIDGLFNSFVPAEEPLPELETDLEFVGDDDIVDDRVAPEKAFETFLGRNFPLDRDEDFSGSIYHAPVEKKSVKHSQRHSVLRGAESRAERLSRLSKEVDALAAECGLAAGDAASDALSQLTDLRNQLRTIEQQFTHVPISLTLPTITSSVRASAVTEGNNSEKAGDSADIKTGEVTVQMISPSITALSGIERRITAIEQSVGVHRLERAFDGASVADTLDDVRTRLALATEPSLSDRLVNDAKRIAHVLKNELQTERGKDALRVGALLDKIEDWQPVVDSLPIVVDRLASVRHFHIEASHFIDAVSALKKQMDSLENRSRANEKLLTSVRHTLEVNMQTVTKNFNLLKDRLEKANGSMLSQN